MLLHARPMRFARGRSLRLQDLLQLLVLATLPTKLVRERKKPEELVTGTPDNVLRLQDVMLHT